MTLPRSLHGLHSELLDLRVSMKLGQIGFAAWLKVDQPTLSKWEQGKRPIPTNVCLELAKRVEDPNRREVWRKACGIDAQEINELSSASGRPSEPIWVSHLRKHHAAIQKKAVVARNKADQLNEQAIQVEIALRIAEALS